MKNNNTLQVIYTYLVDNVEDKDILELIYKLRKYIENGNFTNYEITTTDYSDMFEEMIRDNIYTSKDSIQNMIYMLENIQEELEKE